MKPLPILLLAAVMTATAAPRTEPSLRELFKAHFDIGFGVGVLDGPRTALLRHHASVVSCENDLKARSLRPAPDTWSWEKADAWLAWAESTGARPIGHTLVWCYMMPPWLEEKVKAGGLTKEQALAWQDDHIRRVLGRYGTRVRTWDVVNEALSDDSAPDAPLLRKDPWSDLCGTDYIVAAFRSARAAAPDAKLLYNDYNLELPHKRARLFRLLKLLEEAGCRPDAVGIQGHYNLESPKLEDLEATIREIHAAGYPVHITELDVSVYRWEGGANLQNNGPDGKPTQPVHQELPPELHERLAAQYRRLFEVFLRHADKIERVGFWNTDDGNTWLNNWPVKGRPNHPLLFDRNLQPKPAFHAITGLAGTAPQP